VIIEVLKNYREQIHGMVHCSGGAQTKVLHFVDDLHVIKNNLFTVPPLFKLIQGQSATPWKEMYKVYNMGHRFEIYVKPEIADNIISISKKYKIDARIVGYCETNQGRKLTIKSQFGEFEY
jgi:phosphoribosylformylglycinamidine cyclo-ligase